MVAHDQYQLDGQVAEWLDISKNPGEVGGYALVDTSETGNYRVGLEELGFELQERIREPSFVWTSVGAIVKKTREPIQFHEVWARVRDVRKEMRR